MRFRVLGSLSFGARKKRGDILHFNQFISQSPYIHHFFGWWWFTLLRQFLKFKRAIPKFYQPNSEENFSKGHLFCQKNSSSVVNSERKKKFEKRKHHVLCDFSFIHIQLLADIYSTFCRSFTVLILNNLFFNLELLGMFLRQGFGQSKSQFLGTYQHHQSTVETSQSFHSKPVSQIFGAYIFIQIYIYIYLFIHWICFFSLIIWYICVASFFLLTLSDSMFFAEGIPSWCFLPGCVDRWKWHDWFLCWILSQSSRTFHLPGFPVKTFDKKQRRPLLTIFFWNKKCTFIVFTG